MSNSNDPRDIKEIIRFAAPWILMESTIRKDKKKKKKRERKKDERH